VVVMQRIFFFFNPGVLLSDGILWLQRRCYSLLWQLVIALHRSVMTAVGIHRKSWYWRRKFTA